MRKMKLFKGLCSVLIVFVCSVLCMGSSCIKIKIGEFAEVFENNWGVVLPENMTEEFYEFEDNWGMRLYGIRYTVFAIDEEPVEFINDFDTESCDEIENEVTYLLDKADFKTPEEYKPDWSEKYCWKLLEREQRYSDTDIVINNCYIVYFSNLNRMVICQNFK